MRGEIEVRTIEAMPRSDLARLIETVRAELPADAAGAIRYSALADAIKARAPS